MIIDLYKNYFIKILSFFLSTVKEEQHVLYVCIPETAIESAGPAMKINNPKRKSKYPFQSTATLLLAIFIGTTQTYATVTGPGAAWGFCRKITLSTATPLTNFQVKITLTTATLGNPYLNINSAGNDLRFYDINNNSCNYWIEGTFNYTGTSTIWVNIPANGSTVLYMYYGNAAAPAISNGGNTFDFFDDFIGSGLASNWQTITTNGTISVSGGIATISCTNNTSVNTSPVISSVFTPASPSFWLETKHRESRYNRVRYYANTSILTMGSNPLGFDNGYFYNGGGAQTSANIFWNGFQGTSVSRNNDYLTCWAITDGSTYNWSTLNYPSGTTVDSRTGSVSSIVRYITIGVTEVSNTSTQVDWVRVRKANAAFTDPTATVGSQFSNISATITTQTNPLCNGQSTGSAKVTASGGSIPFSYSWNSTPVQTAQTAVNLPVGSYIATVTDNNGISATATVTLTQPAAVNASATSSNINCFNGSDGQIQVTGSNGITPYTFSINNGSSYQASKSFTNLPSGNYKIRVKDNNGCESALVP